MPLTGVSLCKLLAEKVLYMGTFTQTYNVTVLSIITHLLHINLVYNRNLRAQERATLYVQTMKVDQLVLQPPCTVHAISGISRIIEVPGHPCTKLV